MMKPLSLSPAWAERSVIAFFRFSVVCSLNWVTRIKPTSSPSRRERTERTWMRARVMETSIGLSWPLRMILSLILEFSGPRIFSTAWLRVSPRTGSSSRCVMMSLAMMPALAAGVGTNASADSAYLNELYRSQAEKAGIVYVDIWDGFVDEDGKFSPQGPDYLGQTRPLRTSDGVYFTKFGARKLAHYVEREIERSPSSQRVPVALPVAAEPEHRGRKGKPDGSVRPMAGPVVPLTGANVGSEQVLLGGPSESPGATVGLSAGEAVAAPAG